MPECTRTIWYIFSIDMILNLSKKDLHLMQQLIKYCHYQTDRSDQLHFEKFITCYNLDLFKVFWNGWCKEKGAICSVLTARSLQILTTKLFILYSLVGLHSPYDTRVVPTLYSPKKSAQWAVYVTAEFYACMLSDLGVTFVPHMYRPMEEELTLALIYQPTDSTQMARHKSAFLQINRLWPNTCCYSSIISDMGDTL